MRFLNEVFDELNEAESPEFEGGGDPLILALWSYSRPYVFELISGEQLFPKLTQRRVSIVAIFLALVSTIRGCRKKAVAEDVFFYSGRWDAEGGDKYFGEVRKKTNSAIDYAYLSDGQYISKNIRNILGVKVVILGLSFVFWPLIMFSGKMHEAIKIQKRILLRLGISKLPKRFFVKNFEFILWVYYFRKLAGKYHSKRFHIVSNNFFIPLIYGLEGEVDVIEYSHAFVHPFHYSYSYPWLTSRKYVLPHFLVETKFSFGGGVVYPRDLCLIKFGSDSAGDLNGVGIHRVRVNGLNRKLLVISQPPVKDQLVTYLNEYESTLKGLNVVWCNHPSEPNWDVIKFLGEGLKEAVSVCRTSTYEAISAADLVIGVHSNFLLECARLGIRTAIFDNFYTPALVAVESRLVVIKKQSDLENWINDVNC